jgi:hypothetical protein
MSRRLLTLLVAGLAVYTAGADEIPKGDKVDAKVYTKPYFEKNNSGLTGEASFLAIADQKGFDTVFGVGFVMGKKPDLLPKDAFDKKLVLAVIKRGNMVFEYKDVAVTKTDNVLYVAYTANGKGAGGTAKFASPLIVEIPKGDYKSVVFFENGKKAGMAEIKK